MKALRLHSYLVKQTSEHRRAVRCQCGNVFTPAGGTGVDKGIGDLLVSHPDWGGCWLMLEIKPDDKAPVRPEQAALRDGGFLWVVWDVNQALNVVARFEIRHGFTPRGTR